ncbi:hypothetical protein WKH56_20155 [Priestia sp. SB1]
MDWSRLSDLISKKQYGKLSSEEAYEFLSLLEEALQSQKQWCSDWC